MVKLTLLVILPVLIGLSLVYLPNFWVQFLCLVDFYTPWVLFDSPLYEKYHNFLIDRLPVRPETPLVEIHHTAANYETLVKLSKGFTFPVVIRGLLENSTAIDSWKEESFWMQYMDEEVLCGTLFDLIPDCTIGKFFNELKEGKPFYISGASIIFDNNPELHDMIDNSQIRDIEPGLRKSTQVFMGVPHMGSDIHAAIGVNIFRQIVGQKKWWFIPPSQTPYLIPSINSQGFSAHTKTMVGKDGGVASPWLEKIERFTTVLNPGDVLINPPWFWHGILNIGELGSTDLVVGAPSRYGAGDATPAAFKSNAAFTINALITLGRTYGLAALSPAFKINLQKDIAKNRDSREKAINSAELHPFESAD
mmetsp:Transcript_21952/g.36764  ORF Transcript_21952/g.36764 Transcript_21952/m.36764 type:complete len:364 (-) Transcript_21952:384-1475(-)